MIRLKHLRNTKFGRIKGDFMLDRNFISQSMEYIQNNDSAASTLRMRNAELTTVCEIDHSTCETHNIM